MKEKEIKEKIDEVLKEILLSKTPNHFIIKKLMEKNYVKIEDSLEDLRISIKYLLFDLEATKRESKILRDRLKREKE
jgi:hypothetical protein